jgi:hypothetical protein
LDDDVVRPCCCLGGLSVKGGRVRLLMVV